MRSAGCRITAPLEVNAKTQAKARAHDADLSDGPWALIVPSIPEAELGDQPRKASTQELVNDVLYFVRSGAAWRLSPHELPSWHAVYYYLRHWQRKGVRNHVHHALVMVGQEHSRREASRPQEFSIADPSGRRIKEGLREPRMDHQEPLARTRLRTTYDRGRTPAHDRSNHYPLPAPFTEIAFSNTL